MTKTNHSSKLTPLYKQSIGFVWLLDTIFLQSLLFKCPKNC